MPAPVPTGFKVSESRFERVVLGFLALGFVSLIAAAIAVAWVTGRNRDHTAWVDHTYRVELAIADARRLLEQSETVRRGYLLAPAAAGMRQSFEDTAAQMPLAIARVERLTADNPRQRANLVALDRELAPQRARQRDTIALIGAGRRETAVARFTAELTDRQLRVIRARFATMHDEERRLLILRDAEQRASMKLFFIVLGIAGVLLLLVAFASLGVILRFTRDLTASRDGLRKFNETLEEQVATRTADLSRANEEIQRFAYIVSHDLRSPLVNVMGFTAELETAARPLAELVDRAESDAPALLSDEARLAARQDLPEAIGFIRTSTQKMDRLIAAILKLSREGRRVITPEAIDMDALVRGIRDSLAHKLDADGTLVEVVAPLPPVTSDRLAVDQILSNLIENASKYLQPGRPGRITISGTIAGGRVVYAVADNGRGVAPADHSRVFDLFRRSGSQDQPGEGIGLAHVRALAYRLGGTVDMESELGQGAIFRLHLPVDPGN